jgi:hypothetical protein
MYWDTDAAGTSLLLFVCLRVLGGRLALIGP